MISENELKPYINGINDKKYLRISSSKGSLVIQPGIKYTYIYMGTPIIRNGSIDKEIQNIMNIVKRLSLDKNMIINYISPNIDIPVKIKPTKGVKISNVKIVKNAEYADVKNPGRIGGLLTAVTYQYPAVMGSSYGVRSNYGSNRLPGTTYGDNDAFLPIEEADKGLQRYDAPLYFEE